MEDRRSDTEETFGDEPPPSGVSNQSSEMADAPTESDDPQAHRRPSQPGDREGASGEESQATGNPSNAG